MYLELPHDEVFLLRLGNNVLTQWCDAMVLRTVLNSQVLYINMLHKIKYKEYPNTEIRDLKSYRLMEVKSYLHLTYKNSSVSTEPEFKNKNN